MTSDARAIYETDIETSYGTARVVALVRDEAERRCFGGPPIAYRARATSSHGEFKDAGLQAPRMVGRAHRGRAERQAASAPGGQDRLRAPVQRHKRNLRGRDDFCLTANWSGRTNKP